MNWLSLLQNLGTFATVSGLLVWLLKVLVNQSLSREAELKRAHAIEMEEVKNRFYKHVLFCEEYSAEVYRALAFLFKKGPNADVLQNANALMDIRTKWSVWLTPEIETQLEKFESALRKIGVNAWLLGELRANDNRTEAVKEAYGTFAAAVGWEKWQGEAVTTRDVAAEKVVEGLRDVLGISGLARLRAELVSRAMDT